MPPFQDTTVAAAQSVQDATGGSLALKYDPRDSYGPWQIVVRGADATPETPPLFTAVFPTEDELAGTLTVERWAAVFQPVQN